MLKISEEIIHKAMNIKLLLTDCDGVLTDSGVYYSSFGEELKRFSLRDGMGVERLRNLAEIETGILTGEVSMIVQRRAEKLNISEIHQGCTDKYSVLQDILKKRGLKEENIAYIGDDINDLEVLIHAGLSACPADAFQMVREQADLVMKCKGGHGAFREFAEMIIYLKRRSI
jgi:3-deoxy-D-manno-octulosonate 8-phosphate phosphatase (KDO 8-P phosphatase)